MTLFTKPCTRPGCEGICRSYRPSQHARKLYCSNRCAAVVRVAAGVKPPRLPHEHYVAIGRKGGTQGGFKRRKAAAMRAARDLARLIPKDMELRLSAEDYRRVLALLTRAWRQGRTTERSALRMTRKAAA